MPPSEGKRYRGTADAVFQNLGLIEKSRSAYVLIVSADQVYHMDYGELLYRHAMSCADLTMVAVQYPVQLAGPLGVIEARFSTRNNVVASIAVAVLIRRDCPTKEPSPKKIMRPQQCKNGFLPAR